MARLMGKPYGKPRDTTIRCEHGRRRTDCKACGGSRMCEHGRRRRDCKACGSSRMCEHGRRRRDCKETGCKEAALAAKAARAEAAKAARVEAAQAKAARAEAARAEAPAHAAKAARSRCVHGRQKNKCKECGGRNVCEHGRQRQMCKECWRSGTGGSGFCEHERQWSCCKASGWLLLGNERRMRRTDLEEPVDRTFLGGLRRTSPADLAADEAWRFAPVGVLSHVERDTINHAQLERFARAFGLPLVKMARAVLKRVIGFITPGREGRAVGQPRAGGGDDEADGRPSAGDLTLCA